MNQQLRLQRVTLYEDVRIRRSPVVENERMVALADLATESLFYPCQPDAYEQPLFQGPYLLHLQPVENRMQFDISQEEGDATTQVMLPLSPLRSVIKDYFIICESYYHAISVGNHPQVEAIDMGRRGVHNEGSQMLKDLLKDKIHMDFDTARRLFTLMCVMQIKSGAEVR